MTSNEEAQRSTITRIASSRSLPPFRTSYCAVTGAVVLMVVVVSFCRESWRMLKAEQPSSASITIKNDTAYTSPANDDPLFYFHDPDRFLKEFMACFRAVDSCHILYNHVPKTGGTLIASRFYPLINAEKYQSRKWCCNHRFMSERFWHNTSRYCEQIRFGVYEVRPHEYLQVIHECKTFSDRNDRGSGNVIEQNRKSIPPSRYIGLISIREPIERSLSAIHQECNVHSEHAHKETKGICERCSYEVLDDRLFFDKFVNDTNRYYTGLKDYILSNYSNIGIPLYIIDSDHLDEFFSQLEVRIQDKLVGINQNETFHFPTGKPNLEKTKKLCDFSMPSSLMKKHRPALQAYHWMWSRGYDVK